jgi:hypothetical protein
MNQHRKLAALRALADRPGTEAEGRVAREMLERLESKNQTDFADKPVSERGIWAAFAAQCRGDITTDQFLDELAAWEKERRATPMPTEWKCACGRISPVGTRWLMRQTRNARNYLLFDDLRAPGVEAMSEPRYSGPNRSGVCVCGHSWDRHHLGMVMRQEYVDATGEGYIPQECEAFGFNEAGGLMPVNGEWIHHCSGYRDMMEPIVEQTQADGALRTAEANHK